MYFVIKYESTATSIIISHYHFPIPSKFTSIQKTHHGLSLGIKRADEIRRILLLEPDPGPERMLRVVLENAPGGIINQNQTPLPAHIGQGEGSDDVGPYGLDLVRLAPVDVGAAGDAGGVDDVGGVVGGQVCLSFESE